MSSHRYNLGGLMAWNDRVLVVLYEHKYKDELKHKFEIIRPEDGAGKHYDAVLQKTSYYKKDGVLTRGCAKGFALRDLKWLDENRARVDEALAAKYDAIGVTPKPPETIVDDDGGVEEIPF